MLQIHSIRENREKVIEGLKKRGWSEKARHIVDQVIDADEKRRGTQKALDDLRAAGNRAAKEIGKLFATGQKEAAEQIKAEIAAQKNQMKALEAKMNEANDHMEALLLEIPNIPNHSVPAGTSESDNEVYKDWEGSMPELGADSLPHWELAAKYGLIDFELGVRLTGSGFPLYRGKGARLERALINFFLDEAAGAGYEEILPPLLVNAETARATGQLPDKEGQMYHVEKDGLYLIPTAEVPVTNIFRGEIISQQDLPIRMTGYTPCFRREAGAYGKDVRGLNRVHQFDKVEIVQIVHPDESYRTLEAMLAHVETLLEKLELPYRILRLCGGDLGFTSALTYDFEVYSAAQEKWLEVSSVSNFETFQSHRMMLRYRDSDSKLHLAHTLNGSALALARIVAALLENNQTSDGIVIPSALQSYTGFDRIG